jgi:hypothetical protein
VAVVPDPPGSVDPLLKEGTAMAPRAASTTATRRGRVLRLIFPSRRAVFAAVVVEVAASLVGLPLPLHVIVALVTHVVIALVA